MIAILVKTKRTKGTKRPKSVQDEHIAESSRDNQMKNGIDCWKSSVKKLYKIVDQKTVCGRSCVLQKRGIPIDCIES